MERFNLSFRRTGRFYIEGDCQVELDVTGPARLGDIIAKAQTGDFTKFYPTKIEYFDDQFVFGKANISASPVQIVKEPDDAA